MEIPVLGAEERWWSFSRPLLHHVVPSRSANLLLGAGDRTAVEKRRNRRVERSLALLGRNWNRLGDRELHRRTLLQHNHRLVSYLLLAQLRESSAMG